VSQARALVEAARTQQRELDAAAEARLAFLAELEEAILDEGLDVLFRGPQQSRLDSFAAAFATFDVDPTAGGEAVLARLQEADAPLLLGQALDEYARVHRFFGWNSEEARRLTLLARQVDPDPIRNAMRDAIEGEDRQRLSEFITSDEISTWPPNTVAMLQLAIRSLEMGLDTIPMLRVCQRNNPDNPIINQLLAGRLQFKHGSDTTDEHLREALRFLDAAWAARPDNANVGARLAWALADLGRVDEAVATLIATQKHAPNHAWIRGIGLNNLIKRLEPDARPAATYELFRGFAAVLPDDVVAQNNWAWQLVIDPDSTPQELAEAIDILEQAVEADPEEDAAQNSLGFAYLRRGRWAEAVPHLQASMELTGDPHVHDMLGVAIALWHLDQRLVAREWIFQARSKRDLNDDEDMEQEIKLFWAMAEEVMPEG
jgi:tetratricopeptide (TPR) repeat protein